MFLIILSGQLCEHVRYLDGHVHLFYIPGSDWVCRGDLTDSKASKTHSRENWRFWNLWSTNTLWHIQCDLLVHTFFHMKFKLTIHISKKKSLYYRQLPNLFHGSGSQWTNVWCIKNWTKLSRFYYCGWFDFLCIRR